MGPRSRSDREEAREPEYAARCRGTRGNVTLWAHAIWKYGNMEITLLYLCLASAFVTTAWI